MKTTFFFLFLNISLLSTVQAQSENMALIPGGEFMMGKNINNGLGFSPAHKVWVDSFYMDKTEVSNSEYLKFCQETGHTLPEFWNSDIFRCGEIYPDHPVIGVNHGDAVKYAAWAGKRLPTEAEWEYAARGGLEDRDYPNGNAWHKDRAKQDGQGWKNLTEAVGQYEANGYGLYDMGGNVWEWVSDRYSESYYQQGVYKNPRGPDTGSNRVIRGGSWHSGAMCKKVFYRKGLISSWSDFAVGFRCVKDIK